MWIPCAIEYPNGFRRFWLAWTGKPLSEWDLEHQVPWEMAHELMEPMGLCFGLDANGYAHVTYRDADASRQSRYLHGVVKRGEVRREANDPWFERPPPGRNWKHERR